MMARRKYWKKEKCLEKVGGESDGSIPMGRKEDVD